MAPEKCCLTCGKVLGGRIDQRFCSDKCRKYFKRHQGTGYSGLHLPAKADTKAEKPGLRRTSARDSGTSIKNHFLKTAINLAAKVAENRLIQSQNISTTKGLPSKNGNNLLQIQTPNMGLSSYANLLNRATFSPAFTEFFGDLSFPFRLLVYGMPGNGKSTFCMQLANEIAHQFRILYISGEELLDSATLRGKQNRTIVPQNHLKCTFINRLPNSEEEWRSVLFDKSSLAPSIQFKAIFYDSVTKLGITPFYVDAIANDCKLPDFNKLVSHIFITHAHKDGLTYRGDGSWGHEVDIIIRCQAGKAITEKNRFGQIGRELTIF